MKKIVWFLLAFLFSQNTMAIVYQWPVAERAETSFTGGVWWVTIYARIVTYNQPSWPNNITLGQALYNVGIEFTPASNHPYSLTVIGKWLPSHAFSPLSGNTSYIPSKTTLAFVASEMVRLYSSPSKTILPEGHIYSCYGLSVANRESLQRQWNGNPYDTQSDCIRAISASAYCAPELENIDFDFGSLLVEQANGKKLSKSMRIYCTDVMKYSLSLVSGGSSVNLNNGMKANVTLNDRALAGTVLQGSPGYQNVSIGVELQGTPSRDGAFAGNNTLLVTYP